MDRRWIVVVPVKGLDEAKSRLAHHVGALRRELALAMTLDTVSVAIACRNLHLVVVTDDHEVTAEVRRLGAEVVTDDPRAGINAALVHGAHGSRLSGEIGNVAALAADLPALRRSELVLALSRASSQLRSFVPDAAGTGTTLYAATSPAAFDPRFGPGSAAAHARVATEIESAGLTSLQRDVDTINDLHAAALLGLNRHTAQVVDRLDGTALRAIRPAS